MEIDLETGFLESRFELLPLASRKTIAGVGIQYAGYARHASRTGLPDFNTAKERNHEWVL